MKNIILSIIFSVVYIFSYAQPSNTVEVNNIRITTSMSSCNSAGGRHFEWDITNLSNKTIKYISTKVMAVDNFFSPASCSITNDVIHAGRITGPIEGHPELSNKQKIPNKYIESYQTIDLHYNPAATQSLLLKCKIEFTDNTIVEYTNNELFEYLVNKSYNLVIDHLTETGQNDKLNNKAFMEIEKIYVRNLIFEKYFN